MGKKIFSKLEVLAFWVQLKYMLKHRTTETVEPGRILFHPHDCKNWVLKEYQSRLKKLKIK